MNGSIRCTRPHRGASCGRRRREHCPCPPFRASRCSRSISPTAADVALSLLAALCLLVGAGCGQSGEAPSRWFVAASLGPVADDLAALVESELPSVEVELVVAGSAQLREQLADGAPAAVFLPAAPAQLDLLAASGRDVSHRTPIAGNELVLAVATDGLAAVDEVSDAAAAGVLVGVCTLGVPCGDLARPTLSTLGISPVTETSSVRQLVALIETGELDAGLVYASDVAASEGRLERVPGDLAPPVETTYEVGLVRAAGPSPQDLDVLDVLASVDARSILTDAGFAPS